MSARRVALIAGATGLTGRHLLNLLLADSRYGRVYALVRKPSLAAQPKLREIVVDFGRLPALPNADDVYCCLGTTIRKAGSQSAFRSVDFDYVVNLARRARRSGAKQFLVVSAMGASPTSLFFYNRIKGEMEQALVAIRFSALHIFRPSLLVGTRPESRPGERIGIATLSRLAPLMLGPARKFRPIAAETVARAMLQAAWTGAHGTAWYRSDRIAELGYSSR